MGISLKWLLTTVFFFCTLYMEAQQVVLSGKITDKSTEAPLPNVLVTVRPTGENKIVRYAQSSQDGKYEIKLASFPNNHILHFSMMGYASLVIALSGDRSQYNVKLSEQATELKEVVVKAPSIRQRGDTISYMVSSFADAQDKSLADVLKKMPGIEIEKSGAIKYNGVAINKFYIEGKDLLGGRYGLATNNMHQEDVGSVEVMENHQPIKALEDISFSQNPAINIRLKEDAKARWVGTAKAGAGFEPFLWSAELFVMRFTAKTQSLNTYKTNNTGIDVTQETQTFSIDEVMSQFSKNYRLDNYIDVRPDNLMDIDANRARFNKSHMVSTNNLWGLSKNYDLTSQISYTNNRVNSDNFSRTTYYLKESTIVTDIGESTTSKQNRLSADLVLTANTSAYYLKNKLNADLLWDDIDMGITGTYPNTQSASVPHHRFSNDLEILKRSGNKTYTLNSYNLYQVKPQHLAVSREGEKQQQDVRTSAFYTNTNTSMGFYVKPVTIAMKMGVIGVFRSMESELTGVSETLGVMNNDLSMNYINLYVSPELEYKKDGFEAKFNMPVSFTPYRYHDKNQKATDSDTKFLLSPRLYIRYHFTSRLSVSVSGRLAQSPVEEQQFYSGILLQNYRNLSRGFIDYNTANQKSTSLNIAYKRPLSAFFANAIAIRSWTETKRTSSRFFIDDYILNTFIPQNNNSDVWMLNGSVSKGLDIINGMVSLRSSYMSYNGSIFQNEVSTPYSSDTWSITPKINSRIAIWCNLSYEFNYVSNRLNVKDTGVKSSSESISQVLSCNFILGKKYYIQLTGEHYYNKMSNNVSKHLFLADAEFTYSFANGWELNLSAKNIFNQDEYSYTVYDGLTSMSKEYKIRPRNFLASVFFRF
ncbi:carboxypeptidase-like regulatory domain-containing protein [Bacteroides sp.]|uniref:TonB-dependent receptor n=1 Tax=Bacteroides sp. TaxID=29523 RepID=UPI002FC6801D